jgi:hypothetical protein
VVNDSANDDVRATFQRVAAGVAASPSLETAALARGRRRARRRSEARAGVALAGLLTAFAWYGVAGPGTSAASASVACYADRTVVAHPHAAVSRSGVRIDVTNATPNAVLLTTGSDAVIVPPGRSAVDVALRPGRVEVSCDTGTSVSRAAKPLTVVDRDHLFVDDALDCSDPNVLVSRGNDIQTGDPVALTRARLGHTLPGGAVVEPAGYPGASARRLVRVRDETHIVGLAVWHEMPERGTWTLDELRTCD